MPIISATTYVPDPPDPTPVPKFTDLLDEYLRIRDTFSQIDSGKLLSPWIYRCQLMDREKELKDQLNSMVGARHFCRACTPIGG